MYILFRLYIYILYFFMYIYFIFLSQLQSIMHVTFCFVLKLKSTIDALPKINDNLIRTYIYNMIYYINVPMSGYVHGIHSRKRGFL